MFKSASNPQIFVQNLLQNHPQSAAIMQFINSNGGDPKAAFYSLARQKGINPDEFINSLR